MEENFRILKPYVRGFPIIVFAMVAAFLFTKKYLNYVTPMYESTAKLKLADINNGVPNSNLLKNLDVFVTGSKISAEIELLKSDMLLNKMLEELDFDLEIYRKGKIKTIELYNQSPILIDYTVINDKAYDKLFELTILSENEFSIKTPESDEFIKGIIGDTLILPNIRLAVSLNNSFLEKKSEFNLLDDYQFQILSRQKLLSTVKRDLDLIPVDKEIPIIRLNFKSANPAKASVLVNTLAEVYIDDYIENKFKAANVTVNFLEDQIESVVKKLSRAENNIQSYRDRKGITNIFQQTETDLRKISQLKIQQTNFKMNLEAVQDLERYIKEGEYNFLELAPNFEAFTDLLSTEMVKNIKNFQGEKRDLMALYTPNDEKVKAVDAKINDLTSYLSESISNTRKNLEIKYGNLSRDITEAEKVFIGVPKKEKMLTILNREFQIYQQSYNFLNKKKIEAEIAQAAKITFHRVITPAKVSKTPISPNKTIITIAATILGMFGAIVLIYIVHLLKAKVNDKQTLESNSRVPVAMLTPLLKEEQKIEKHFLQEAIQLDIKGLIKDRSIICINAFNPQHGAKFNSIHLAKALAQQGKKVLFVDVEGVMNLRPDNKRTPVNLAENLDSITLNEPSFNLFTKGAMESYLKDISQPYDIIVILNEKLGNLKSIMLMSLSTTNLVVMDSRLTPAKKIMDVDLLKEEYNLPEVHFLLNRYGYNTNIVKELFNGFLKIFKKGNRKTGFVNSRSILRSLMITIPWILLIGVGYLKLEHLTEAKEKSPVVNITSDNKPQFEPDKSIDKKTTDTEDLSINTSLSQTVENNEEVFLSREIEKEIEIEKEDISKPQIEQAVKEVFVEKSINKTSTRSKKYHLIVGSFKGLENAQKRMRIYQNYYTDPSIIFLPESRMYHVSVFGYNSREEASIEGEKAGILFDHHIWILKH
jgi:uncharacterized protein involved in exopolysaccharide biosynthesis